MRSRLFRGEKAKAARCGAPAPSRAAAPPKGPHPLSKRVFSPCLYKQTFALVLSEPGRLYGAGPQGSMAGMGQRPPIGAGEAVQGSPHCRSGPFRDPSPAGAEVQVAGAGADHTAGPRLVRLGGAGAAKGSRFQALMVPVSMLMRFPGCWFLYYCLLCFPTGRGGRRAFTSAQPHSLFPHLRI